MHPNGGGCLEEPGVGKTLQEVLGRTNRLISFDTIWTA
jgi:hypothetical protein